MSVCRPQRSFHRDSQLRLNVSLRSSRSPFLDYLNVTAQSCEDSFLRISNLAQGMAKDLRKVMDSELKRLEQFESELSPEGLKTVGGVVCGAHYLQMSLEECDGPLMAFEAGKF